MDTSDFEAFSQKTTTSSSGQVISIDEDHREASDLSRVLPPVPPTTAISFNPNRLILSHHHHHHHHATNSSHIAPSPAVHSEAPNSIIEDSASGRFVQQGRAVPGESNNVRSTLRKSASAGEYTRYYDTNCNSTDSHNSDNNNNNSNALASISDDNTPNRKRKRRCTPGNAAHSGDRENDNVSSSALISINDTSDSDDYAPARPRQNRPLVSRRRSARHSSSSSSHVNNATIPVTLPPTPISSASGSTALFGERHSRFFNQQSTGPAQSVVSFEEPDINQQQRHRQDDDNQPSDDFQSPPNDLNQNSDRAVGQEEVAHNTDVATGLEISAVEAETIQVQDQTLDSAQMTVQVSGNQSEIESISEGHIGIGIVTSNNNNSSNTAIATENSATGESTNAEDKCTCPICFEPWTVGGRHRIVSLKCGHLFGLSCIKKWAIHGAGTSSGNIRQRAASRNRIKCPECNQVSSRKDIRPIFVRNITAQDSEKLDKAESRIKDLSVKNNELESTSSHFRIEAFQMRNEVTKLRSELKESFDKRAWLELDVRNLTSQVAELAGMLDKMKRQIKGSYSRADCDSAGPDIEAPEMGNSTAGCDERTRDAPRDIIDDELLLLSENATMYRPKFRHRFTVPLALNRAQESSRLLVTDPHDNILYASYSKPCIKYHTLAQIDITDPTAKPIVMIPIHSEEIRGAEISPHNSGNRYLLTASFDQTAALTALSVTPPGSDLGPQGTSGFSSGSAPKCKRTNPMLASKFKLNTRGWSCAWDPHNPNLCYIGAAKGRVMMFDLRMTSGPVHSWNGPSDGSYYFSSSTRQPLSSDIGFSPIHSIIAIPDSADDAGATEANRLIVANSHHAYSLPLLQESMTLAQISARREKGKGIDGLRQVGSGSDANGKGWLRLTDEAPGRSCYSISFDRHTRALAISFRSNVPRPCTVHDMYGVLPGGDGDSWWKRKCRFVVNSAQLKLARTNVFSFIAGGGEYVGERVCLFGAGVEDSKSIRVWNPECPGDGTELGSIYDIGHDEDVVDLKGWQCGPDAMFASLTNSTVRVYDVC